MTALPQLGLLRWELRILVNGYAVALLIEAFAPTTSVVCSCRNFMKSLL
ncbi:hypothetical protein PMI09_00193 [Rhizobium sp. CF122]|nr:hypothetical protein PMI09_00193 [Rhizobium sp. CF122]